MRDSALISSYVLKDDALPPNAQVALIQPDDAFLQRLLPVASRIFRDTFAPQFEPEALEAFLDEVYRPDGSMRRDFNLPDVLWRVATCNGDPNVIGWHQPLETTDGVPLRIVDGPDNDGDYELEPVSGDLSLPTQSEMGWPLIIRPDGRHWILLDDAPTVRDRA